MFKSSFTLADFIKTAEALYGRGWPIPMSRDLKIPLHSIREWLDSRSALPDIRHQLADTCRRYAATDRKLATLAPFLEKLGPPEKISAKALSLRAPRDLASRP
jgi:hypothetical protein